MGGCCSRNGFWGVSSATNFSPAAVRRYLPNISLTPGVAVGGGFHDDAEGRFLIFKEWKRLKATHTPRQVAATVADVPLEIEVRRDVD